MFSKPLSLIPAPYKPCTATKCVLTIRRRQEPEDMKDAEEVVEKMKDLEKAVYSKARKGLKF